MEQRCSRGTWVFGFDNNSMALLDDHGKQDMIPPYLVFRLFNQ